MTTWNVQMLVNTSRRPESWLTGYAAGDPLATLPHLAFTVDTDDPAAAPDALWGVGQKVGTDATGKTWPRWVRSLSIGDVAVVTSPTGEPAGCYRAVTFGWEPIEGIPPFQTSLDALVQAGAAAPETEHGKYQP
jgi:hypothetical protein